MAKALGVDIKEFYDKNFPEGYFHDDNSLEFHDSNGAWLLNDQEKYNLSECGVVVREDGTCVENFSTLFNRWNRQRGVVTLLVVVPVVKLDFVKNTLVGLGLELK